MPRRTPVGAELLRRVNGFRAYLQTAGPTAPTPPKPRTSLLPYLPYAIVFGLTEQWTRTLALVGAPAHTPWYQSRRPYTPHRFHSGIVLFSSSSAATLTAAPPAVSGASGFGSGGSSGGGGFSGGGGGGGGGSW